VVERVISRKTTSCMTSSVDGSNSLEFFMLEHLMGHIYVVPPRATVDIMAKFQTAVTAIDAYVLRRVRGNAVRRTALFLEMGAGRFKHLL
jgi:hypothetical protein